MTAEVFSTPSSMVAGDARLTLFCLAHAGSSATLVYRDWQRHLPSWIRVHPLELAGHGTRIAEPFAVDLDAVAQELIDHVSPWLHAGRYAVFGHSMGALLAYLLVGAIANIGSSAPQAVFLSGRSPPHLPMARRLQDLDDRSLLAGVRALGGTPDALFDQQEVIDLFLPILRSDYALVENWALPAVPHVTSTDLVLLYGGQDPLTPRDQVLQWARYGSGHVCAHAFSGGHFFPTAHAAAVCELVARHLGKAADCAAGDWLRTR